MLKISTTPAPCGFNGADGHKVVNIRLFRRMEHLSLRKQLNNAAQTTRDNTADHSVAILSRWVLVVICLLTVGSHVGKHFISSLGPAVMERLSLSRAEFGLLFSLQGIPGAVLPVLGGILIAALHLPYGHVAAILATVVLFGQILTCFAVQLRSFPIVLLGYVKTAVHRCESYSLWYWVLCMKQYADSWLYEQLKNTFVCFWRQCA